MKTYEKYKDSGIEWIGEIPEHWETLKIKQLAVGENTLFLDGDWIESKNIIFDEGDYRYITTGNIGEGKYKEQGNTYITQETFEELNCLEVYTNDLVISRLNHPLGRTCIIPDLNNKIVTSVDNVVLRPNKKYSKEFLNCFFSNSKYFDFTKLEGRGATMQRISRTILANIKIVLPPTKEEQTAIANYLDKKTAEIDQLIAEKEQLVALYQEEKTAIINQAVTKGINPDVKLKDSGIEWLGDIPEHWEDIRLKYLGNFINGYSFKSTDFKSSGVRVLKISNIQHMSIDWSDESFIDEEFYDTKSDFRVLQNDLVFALTRPIISTGIKVALMDSDEKILLNQRNSIFRPKMKMTKWIYFILLSSRFVQEFDKQIDKTGQQPNISSNDIGEISIPVPPKEEQTEIVQHIENESERIDAKIAKAEKYINLLTEYRTALISEVVTGKIKVI